MNSYTGSTFCRYTIPQKTNPPSRLNRTKIDWKNAALQKNEYIPPSSPSCKNFKQTALFREFQPTVVG